MAQYTAKHRKFTWYGHITPNVAKFEGIDPSLQATVAPYLPLVRYNEWDRDYIVISTGKAIAYDSYGYLVPAGLALEIAAVENEEAATILYSDDDEAEGVVGPDGEAVTSGDSVAEKLISAGITVSRPFAIAYQTYYRANSDEFVSLLNKTTGQGGVLPTEFRFHNYNPQSKVSVLCDYVIELPIVNTYDPPFAGIAAFDAQSGSAYPTPGAYVKIDKNSNFVLLDEETDSPFDKVGQVLMVDRRFPKGYLDYVRTVFGTNTGGGPGTEFDNALDKMPGSASGGLPDQITFAGGSATLGMVSINLTEW